MLCACLDMTCPWSYGCSGAVVVLCWCLVVVVKVVVVVEIVVVVVVVCGQSCSYNCYNCYSVGVKCQC